MTTTYAQAEAEREVFAALAATGSAPEQETVSDAVDVYLGRAEREQGQPIDRNAIPHEIVFSVLDTIVRDTHTND